ncbi:TonB-dependent heme/hemoglobin receptor family protein/TonB-dependent hemoglobin/transferrin/lactoferrin receptor family protein [Sterolibacterium denitrificans]|uniref:TonB-dependent heme/hemoglobin receptor family protein/TonB-dependent hemoglobin/transferrin/lactoferrin receptor family protein n=1 Tax=Sterolibacterium denitrificans TaxID=157592 RepID=A0A7Z7HP20_9PROT|nr:TonB-dependent hemoglobin/transferrin/lactoferrin family receptor [Sterolibacterium denitrificans]SMB21100.1 TonB-dependent heme/hemoglobin receptor family protein/TonB-dependent hemoglobin/transferrin/lactoferrin receptor family protein [Sterolibacterium denitrificans]
MKFASPRSRRKLMHTAVLLSLAPLSMTALADTTLKETVVTATRSEAAIDDLPVTVTTVTREDMDRRPVLDEVDLFRDDPDIVMARDLRRHGATRVNIRGIEDTRVVQTVDGVRMDDYYDKSGPTNYVTNNPLGVMPDFLRQVEIVRGPASSLYGSDALGGVVGYLTLNPEDIAPGDKKTGVRVKGTWTGANDGLTGTVIGAWRGETTELLLGWSQIRSKELETKGTDSSFGPNRTEANKLDTDDRGGIAKLILKPAVGHRLTATVDGRIQETDSDIRRHAWEYNTVTKMLGDDETSRLRASLEYEHKPASAFYDRMTARLSHQRSETENKNFQQRGPARYLFNGSGCSAESNAQAVYLPIMPTDLRGWLNANCDMQQSFQMEQTQTAFNLQFESAFDLASVSHLLTYGADLRRQEVETLRDGTITLTNSPTPILGPLIPPTTIPGINPAVPPAAGTVIKNSAGEVYPLRDFPNGTTDTIGLFVQDEIALFNDRLTLTPGIRYDWTRLKPEVDALAAVMLNSLNVSVSTQKYSRASPKLGWQWKFTPAVSTYGQIASGFRAPNYNEVNGSFRNTTYGYGITPNPNLKPETSVGVELGLRASGEAVRGQFSVFDNRYKDFIESGYLSCPTDPACIPGLASGTLQYRNLSKVRIYGAEVRGSWNFAPGWQADGAIAYSHGTDTDRSKPLNSVDPLRASFGLGYAENGWGAEGRLRAAVNKTRIDDSGLSTPRSGPQAGKRQYYYRTPGYGVIDLAVWVKPSRDTRVTLALNNAFDKKYWIWSDIRHMDVHTSTPGVDFYSQPGRNVRLAFQADF